MADTNADTAKFASLNPHTPINGFAVSLNVESGGCADHDFLESVDEIDDFEARGFQMDDGVGDQLARSVEGDITSPFSLDHFYPSAI